MKIHSTTTPASDGASSSGGASHGPASTAHRKRPSASILRVYVIKRSSPCAGPECQQRRPHDTTPHANIATAASAPATVAKSEKASVSDAPLSLLPLLVPFELPELVGAALAPERVPEPEAEAPEVATAAKMSVDAYVLQLLVAAEVGV